MDKIKTGKQLIEEFEFMRDMAEIKALSKVSLEQPLTQTQIERMLQLKKKLRFNYQS